MAANCKATSKRPPRYRSRAEERVGSSIHPQDDGHPTQANVTLWPGRTFGDAVSVANALRPACNAKRSIAGRTTRSTLWDRGCSVDRLVQIVHFDEGDSGGVIHTLHNGGVVPGL